MKDLTFTKDQLINSLFFDETDYNKATEGSSEYATFDEFIDKIMDSCRECNGTLLDAIFLADNSFEGLGKKIFDVQFDDNDNTNSEGFRETYGYCKNYIKDNNGTNWSYFEDYKGGTVSIMNEETGEIAYWEEVK